MLIKKSKIKESFLPAHQRHLIKYPWRKLKTTTKIKLSVFFFIGIRKVQDLIKTPSFQEVQASFGPSFSGCLHLARDSDAYWECYIRHFMEPGHNPVSTNKMGSVNDGSTVVGPDLK